jgi:putative membrane protein
VENVTTGLKTSQKCRGIFSGTIAGMFVGFLPGITSAAGTVLARLISGKNEENRNHHEQKEFIVAISGVNTSAAIFTILALFVILKARSGVMHTILELNRTSIFLWEPFSNLPVAMILMFIAVLITAIISLPLVILVGKVIATRCNKIPYTRICMFITIFLVAMIFLFSGVLGLTIAFIATCIGLIPPLIGIKRIHLMGCLILPVILYFFGIV